MVVSRARSTDLKPAPGMYIDQTSVARSDSNGLCGTRPKEKKFRCCRDSRAVRQLGQRPESMIETIGRHTRNTAAYCWLVQARTSRIKLPLEFGLHAVTRAPSFALQYATAVLVRREERAVLVERMNGPNDWPIGQTLSSSRYLRTIQTLNHHSASGATTCQRHVQRARERRRCDVCAWLDPSRGVRRERVWVLSEFVRLRVKCNAFIDRPLGRVEYYW